MPQPKHTESSILESYLLPPSPLPTLLPYQTFLTLVPTQHRSNPILKRLYRDLQFQRTIDIDAVRLNIEREVARGPLLKSHLLQRISETKAQEREREQASRKRKRDEEHGDGDSDEFDDPVDTAIDATYQNTTLHPAHTNPSLPASTNHPLTAAMRKYHTAVSLSSALRAASTALESEISDLEAESVNLLAEMNEIVGSLSDLRYGRFARPVSGDAGAGHETVEDEVLEALRGLERRIEETLES